MFIVFNRPAPTLQVLKQIRKAKPKLLFVAQDGPRLGNEDDRHKVKKVLELIKETVDWDCKIEYLVRETNLGCRRAVSEAINWFFEYVDRGIILEDDCFPEQSFFRFCDETLDFYQNDPRIGAICGTRLGKTKSSESSFSLSFYGGVWGWATWKNRWQTYYKSHSKWNSPFVLYKICSCFSSRNEFLNVMNVLAATRNHDTWDFHWFFTRLANRFLTVVPRVNLISNLGFGKEATHTTGTNEDLAELPISPHEFPLQFPDIEVDRIYDTTYAQICGFDKLTASRKYYNWVAFCYSFFSKKWNS